jgi:hypothetical protein
MKINDKNKKDKIITNSKNLSTPSQTNVKKP